MKAKKDTNQLDCQIPEQLRHQMDLLVREGWFRDREEIVNMALRKFLESNRPELIEKHIREDIEWGLHGIG